MRPDRESLIALAHQHGFEDVRFANVTDPAPFAEAYTAWIKADHHADMHYLSAGLEDRVQPARRLPTVRTAMVLSVRHAHVRPADPGGLTGKVARYAWGRDYHNLIGKRLKKLRRDLRALDVQSWGGVDTAPILERGWATAAGLGFNGKNGVQIWPARTSYMFLSVLFLDVPVAADTPLRDHCGSCSRCLVACPTRAFQGPRVVKADRCIAYWTIEARGLAPRALRPGFGRWLFGCDICQEVCPHNVACPPDQEPDLQPKNAWLDLPDLLSTPDEHLMERFLGTPLRRPKGHGLKRNALVVLANLGDPAGVPAAEAAMDHPQPVVRQAAVWALQVLGAPPPAHLRDPDPEVQAELDAGRP